MTIYEKRVAIAKFCGWKWDMSGKDWHSPNGQPGFTNVPDYFTGLNEMHQAEECLNAEQRSAYTSILFQKAWVKDRTRLWILTHASCNHRAQAFGRATGLW